MKINEITILDDVDNHWSANVSALKDALYERNTSEEEEKTSKSMNDNATLINTNIISNLNSDIVSDNTKSTIISQLNLTTNNKVNENQNEIVPNSNINPNYLLNIVNNSHNQNQNCETDNLNN